MTTTTGDLPADATIVLPPGTDMDSPEAQDTRRNLIGASEVASIFGLGHDSAYRLWLDKRGYLDGPGRFTGNDATEWGHIMEDPIAQWFGRRHPEWDITPSPGTIVRAAAPHLGVTPDRGMTHREVGTRGALECKTGNEYTKADWLADDDAMPPGYLIQNLMQQWAWGRTTGYVVALLGGSTPVIRHVEWDADTAEQIVAAVEAWWADHIEADVPPPIDGSDSTVDVLNALYAGSVSEAIELPPGAVAWQRQAKAAAAEASAAEKRAVEAKNNLRAMIGEYEEAWADGLPIATWKRTGAFNADRFTADHPDIAEKHTHLVPVLDRKAIERDHPALYRQYRSRVLLIKNPPAAPSGDTTTKSKED